jgi:hypothetical protein
MASSNNLFFYFSACSPCFNPSCLAIAVSREIFRLDADALVELKYIRHLINCEFEIGPVVKMKDRNGKCLSLL